MSIVHVVIELRNKCFLIYICSTSTSDDLITLHASQKMKLIFFLFSFIISTYCEPKQLLFS